MTDRQFVREYYPNAVLLYVDTTYSFHHAQIWSDQTDSAKLISRAKYRGMAWKRARFEVKKIIEDELVYEDQLPEMSDVDYSRWFDQSKVIFGVRMGPKVLLEPVPVRMESLLNHVNDLKSDWHVMQESNLLLAQINIDQRTEINKLKTEVETLKTELHNLKHPF